MQLHEEGTLASLWTSLRDVFFPVKLPPLVLESKPIAVVDRMATKQDPRATAASFVIYALLVVLFWWLVKQHVHFAAPPKPDLVTQPYASADGPREGRDGRRRRTARADPGDQGADAEVC